MAEIKNTKAKKEEVKVESKNTKASATKKTPSKTTVAKKTTATKSSTKNTATKKSPVKKRVVSEKKTNTKVIEPKSEVKATTRKRKAPAKGSANSTKKEVVSKTIKQDKNSTKKDLCIISIFKDIITLYKNFIHWNLSKILIYSWSILLWLILTLPFFVIYSLSKEISLWKVYIDFLWSISLSNIELIFTNLFYFFESIFYSIILILSWDYLSILYIVWWLFFLFGFLYSYPLLINLSNSYLDWEKLSIKENSYFSIKKIIDFSLLSLLNLVVISLYLISFSLILFLISYLLSLYAGSGLNLWVLLEVGEFNYASISMIIYLIIGIIGFIYLFFRIIFSYFYFCDKKYNKEPKKVFSYFRESFISTRGFKLFCKFVFLNFIWIIVYFLILLLFVYLLNILWISEKTSLISVTIFSFIFFYWLFVSIYSSFFRREISK